MIKIYSKDETEFKSMGLGFLDEATRCEVKTEINKDYYLELDYPISGNSYKYIQLDNIIYCKSDLYKGYQPYRIYEKSIPLEGNITIKAQHISYDLCGFRVANVTGVTKLSDAISIIQNGVEPHSLFHFTFDIPVGFDPAGELDIVPSTNLKQIFTEIIDKFKVEFDYDCYTIKIRKKLGTNRGLQIQYGTNLTNLDHISNNSKVYTGIFPYYMKETNKTTSSTSSTIRKAYADTDETYRYCCMEFLYDSSDIINRIAWLPNEQMHKVDNTSVYAFEYEGEEWYVNLKDLVYGMVSNSPYRWWILFNGTPPEDQTKIITCNKFNTDLDNYSHDWLLDDNDQVINPEVIKSEGKYIYCSFEETVPESFWGCYLVPTDLKREVQNDEMSVRMWSHVLNGAYISPTDDSHSSGWLVDINNEIIDPTPDELPYKYLGEVVTPAGNILDFQGELLPFVILGKLTSPGHFTTDIDEYMKVYEWVKAGGKFKEAGTSWINKIKSLWQKITRKQTTPNTVYVTLEDTDEYPDGVIYLNGHSSSDNYQKILSLDISDYVKSESDTPTKTELKDAYNENKKEIEKDYKDIETDISASFINLSSDTLYSNISESEYLELGDLVNIKYINSGVDVYQRVTSITFDAISNKYIEISVEKEEEEEDGE